MESVAATALEYERAPHKALEDLRNALARFEQTYNPTLLEGWDYRLDVELVSWRFFPNGRVNLTDMQIPQRLKFVFQCVALARKHEPELFGILDVASKEGELDVVSWISNFIRWGSGRETIEFDSYPLQDFEQKLHAFEYELLRSDRYVKASPTSATPLARDPFDEIPNPPLDDSSGNSENSDGIHDSLMQFRWGGQVVEGFTPTAFDVLKAMWEMLDNNEHRIRRADVATFLPDRMATWDYDPDLKSFSKYQTEIRKAFEAAGMPCPWEYNSRTKHYVKSAVYCAVDER